MKELKSKILELISKKENELMKINYDIDLCYKLNHYIQCKLLNELKEKIENDISDLRLLLE